ncbi:MAG: hypothetical protein NT062_10080 [Proteobacteria bacterium]|nr:hypothetical protein [Pseudomonadota bacterium]
MVDRFTKPTATSPNPPKPPRTRAECPTVTATLACPHVTCRHHTYPELEPAGRPSHRGIPEPRIVPKTSSCSLEIADGGPLETAEIATLMQISVRRTEQLLTRGLLKLRAGIAVLDHADEVRAKLPAGTELHTVFHAEGTNPGVMIASYVIAVDPMPPALAKPPRRRIERDTPLGFTAEDRANLIRTDPDRERRERAARSARDRRAAAGVADAIEPGAEPAGHIDEPRAPPPRTHPSRVGAR